MPHTLLLADDSVTIQRVIELTFADQDVKVVAVSDGDQAIERLEASPPDIVLADIGMPGKNGYEVAQYMRQSPRLAHIPVVLLTGAFEPVDHARAAEAGCDGVLAKPFEPQLVIGRVKELLARPSAPAPAHHTVVAAPPPSTTPASFGSWPPAAAEETPFAAAPASEAPVDLDAYFDRLDAAFSNLPSSAPVASNTAPTPPPAPASAAPEIDWFSAIAPDAGTATDQWDVKAPSTTETPDLPLSQPPAPLPEPPSPAPAEPVASSAPAPAAEPVAAPLVSAPIAASAPQAPPPTPRSAALPPLADAFAALLAAEEHEGASSAAAWPAAPPSAINEQMVDEVTRRVLDRLSDQVVRETVAGIVSKVAEQLVRDEIERIKAAIK